MSNVTKKRCITTKRLSKMHSLILEMAAPHFIGNRPHCVRLIQHLLQNTSQYPLSLSSNSSVVDAIYKKTSVSTCRTQQGGEINDMKGFI